MNQNYVAQICLTFLLHPVFTAAKNNHKESETESSEARRHKSQHFLPVPVTLTSTNTAAPPSGGFVLL